MFWSEIATEFGILMPAQIPDEIKKWEIFKQRWGSSVRLTLRWFSPKVRAIRGRILTLPVFQRDLRPSRLTLPPGALLRGGNWPVPYRDICICLNKRLILAGSAVARSHIVRFPVAFWKELPALECLAFSHFCGALSSWIFWSFVIYKRILYYMQAVSHLPARMALFSLRMLRIT